MLVTSILKLSTLRYLSLAFQFNEDFTMVGLPCLYLCGSLVLAVAAGHAPVSVSLGTVITTVATWIAAWITISWMPSGSAITA